MKKARYYLLFGMAMAMIFNLSGRATTGILAIDTPETFKYAITVNGKTYEERTTYRSFSKGKQVFFAYTSTGNYSKSDTHQSNAKHRWEVVTDSQGHPLTVSFICEKNHVKTSYNGKGGVTAEVAWYGKNIVLTEGFKKNVTMENALVARTLDLSCSEKYVFDLIQIREMPQLKTYEMYFQVVGDETVSVKAGVFKCKKVLFSINGFFGLFYKAYYYITDDNKRYIVKMENMPQGGSSELLSIHNGE